MIIWQYRYPTDGPQVVAYGCPVTVRVPGVGEVQAVYQFQGGPGGQKCAVVHHASGMIVAVVKDTHTGYPQERAQQAVDEHTAGKNPARVRSAFASATVINFVGCVSGNVVLCS